MDWEAAFQRCPAFGYGKWPEQARALMLAGELRDRLGLLREACSGEAEERLEAYLALLEQYALCHDRYYYYRGILHGCGEALSIWAEEHET